MPNRILKESICASDTIDGLSWFEEVLFYRLIVNCDDYGRYDGRPSIIKNRLFPLKENLTIKAVSAALDSLANAGLVTLYEFEGKPFLYLPTWNAHQSIRAKKSKYPDPADCTKPSEIICKQMQADVTVIQSNPIQSESNSTELPSAPPVLTLPLLDGTEYGIREQDISEWQDAFPNVDVLQELKAMKLWCRDNPKKRKTKNGVRRFITGWLDKEQNRGGNRTPQPAVRQQTQSAPPDASKRERGPTFLPDWAE